MKEYRVMKEPEYKNIPAPYYIEQSVRSLFREKWRVISSGYHSVYDAALGIERIEAEIRRNAERANQKPREVSLGYVANDGKYHELRRD